MQSLLVTALGATPVLRAVPVPEPGPGEVLIKVAACGLNFADLLMIRGEYQEKPALPFAPGMEIAGHVAALGAGVAGPAPGSRVAAVCGHGGLAQYATAAASACVALPEAMGFETAAGFQVAYGTSHLGLTRRARLQAGETLLVLGAAGGVGLTAVEVGKALGARVIAVARGADKLAVARAAGADHLIDSGSADLRAELKALGGVDVVYDPVGGAGFEAALRACRPEARVLVIGFASGQVPPVPANIILVKNISVIGFYWGGYRVFAPEVMADSLAELMRWFAAGRLKPHVSHVLPPERLDEALELIRSRRSTGKVVIRFGD
jgi:NADPH2:quinone reductase